MARTDTYQDAMLRHLSAAYYESLHGRTTRADATRALDTVEEHLNEQAPPHQAARPRRHAGHARRHWARKARCPAGP